MCSLPPRDKARGGMGSRAGWCYCESTIRQHGCPVGRVCVFLTIASAYAVIVQSLVVKEAGEKSRASGGTLPFLA